jgi:eukaryotic-like serine/threonine-protein kinase
MGSAMDSTRWKQVQVIFHHLAELSISEQGDALEELSMEDPELFVLVADLLQQDKQEEFVLNRGIAPLAERLIVEAEETEPKMQPRNIGPYRLGRMLGQGGMGVVYLAERSDIGGFVAIKLLRDAWLSPDRRRRFTSEQRTLAQLNHPAIARLYDADTLADGTPWFVMEYVDGVPLTEYLEQHYGKVEDCFRLFRSVCGAVLYAHRRAIIHRDLKPSNVLITANGEVKLLDFGIAKHLDEIEGDATVTGLRPMTPAYAAPEQQQGGAVGVFTDVYALGVLLYELLTGKLPFDEVRSAQRPVGLDPVRPSKRTNPERFSEPVGRAAWADLDVLCLTAMRAEPERRYQSVEALIRDIDAFLEKRPLEARADRWSYRLSKFTRRHRIGLTYALTSLLIIAGLIGFFTFRLERARNEALAEAARTARMQQFTTNLFQGGDASAGPAEDLRVATLLDRGLEEARSLSADPEMQADMRETLGNIYRKLGDPQKADLLLSAALETRRTLMGPRHRKIAQTLVALGLVRKDEAKLDEAEALVRLGLAMDQAVMHREDSATKPALETDMVALGSVLEAKGNYTEAIHVLEDALKLHPQTSSPGNDGTANLRELANVHFYAGHYAVADSLNRQVLAIHRSMYGEQHPEVAEDLNNLGAIQHELGNLHEAELDYRKSLGITEKWYGAEHPNTAEDLTSLGRTLVIEKKYDEAKPVLERALQIQKTVHGHDHPTVASALNELGNMASLQNAYPEAEARFAEALQIWRTVYGNGHQFIGVGLSNLGSVYMGEKNYGRAEEMYRQAVQVFILTVHEDHTNTGIAHIKLGRALLRQKRYSEAEAETLRGYQTLIKLVPPSNGFVIAARKDLTAIYTGLNRKADAERYRTDS